VGNHVVIIKGDVGVILGHMQKGSIPVKVGDAVETGEVIGKVGSSGMADQPHLHIQTMKVGEGSIWTWEGVPVLFDGKNPVKNTLSFKRFKHTFSSLPLPPNASAGQGQWGEGDTGPMRTKLNSFALTLLIRIC
jgi:murein DD-endopeptidase MepM/ murein hydrolase activator NlpD